MTTDRLTVLRVGEGERVEADQLLGWFGDREVRVVVGGVAVSPGDWIYADADGVLVSRQQLV